MEVSLLARANQLLCDERYDEALAAYGLCVDGDEKCAAAYSGRCFVYLKREKYTAALQDANMALAEDAACEAAFYRKGLACFHLDEFETALDSFQRGLALCGAAAASSVVEGRKYHMWVRKCEAEIEDDDSASEEEEEDEFDDDDGDAEATMETDEPVAPIAVAPAPEPGLKVVPCTVKYQYYQTSSHLTITLLCKNVTEEEATIEIKPTTLVVKIRKGDTEMTVISGELYDPVLHNECKVKYFNSKIDIKLKKKEAYNWNELLKGDLIGEPAKKPPTVKPAAPPTTTTATPYATKRDWNQLEKEMELELEKDKPEGEEALNKLFQDIYGKATPETRRAMNKSFQTSGGTVLSTNWGEVGKTNYEDKDVRQAPAGMEWKDWEGRKLPQKDSSD